MRYLSEGMNYGCPHRRRPLWMGDQGTLQAARQRFLSGRRRDKRTKLANSQRAYKHESPTQAAARNMQSEDYQEGPRAFIEKRAPRWSGR